MHDLPKTAGVARFSISLEPGLAHEFDHWVASEGYPTRSEAVKALIRQGMVARQWTQGGVVAGAITMVYDHHGRDLVNRLLDVQHEFVEVIVSNQHVHLDHHDCLEILTVRGPTADIQRLVAALKAVKGLKHHGLIMTTAGHELA
jgi:CopG family nickel-responsive transcriptional regulator